MQSLQLSTSESISFLLIFYFDSLLTCSCKHSKLTRKLLTADVLKKILDLTQKKETLKGMFQTLHWDSSTDIWFWNFEKLRLCEWQFLHSHKIMFTLLQYFLLHTFHDIALAVGSARNTNPLPPLFHMYAIWLSLYFCLLLTHFHPQKGDM